MTGKRDVYSNKDAIEFVKSIQFVSALPPVEEPIPGEPTPEEPGTGTDLTIQDARNTATGETVTVQGIVTANSSKTFIQDSTAGINLYSQADTTSLSVGDEVKVTGERVDYNGLQEISNYTVEVISSGNIVTPQVVTIDQVNEDVESELIKLENVTIGPVNTGGNTSLQDENGNTINIYKVPALDGISMGDVVNVTAFGSEFKGTYQLHVENASDVEFVSAGDNDNGDPNTFKATVKSVTDGDTIKIEPALFGSDTIRYLNIDTPETYHQGSYDMNLVNTDPDHAQKYHGELAKQHLNTLLQPGDEVILKVGEEVTDAYGRILAQVIRKSDGLNTNLDMVEQGYASTYFIWPVGDETTYNAFQAAVKRASDSGLGIWSDNHTDALELPFVFRAREQGKGLSRYVGNSDTKQYVQPKDWATVPVEKRIFFSEEEAIANGYTPVFERDAKIADARYVAVGSSVTVEGVVTHINGANHYIQDETAGIVVRSYDLGANIGDKIKASGVTSEYYGMLQVTTEAVEVVEAGVGVPNPNFVDATDLGESLEGTLVALENVSVESVDTKHNYTAKDGYGNTFVIDSDSDLVETGKTYDTLIGVVDYNFGVFKVMPRSEDDIIADIPVIKIAVARALELDTKVQVEGVVTAINGKNYYIQDETAAIVVRVEEAGFTAEVGDKIRGKARTEEYFGLLQIIPTLANVSVTETGVGTPEPKLITSSDMGEALESKFVVIKNVTINSVDSFGNYQATDANGSLVIDNDRKFLEVGKTYEQIIGVLDYNYDEYKIMPRSIDDVTVAPVDIPLTTISETRTQEIGTLAKVEGVITAKFGRTTYIQDETAGIVLYGSEVAANVGDKVEVIGTTKEHYGLYELVDFDLLILEAEIGTPYPKVVTSTDLGESLEGQLVTLENVTVGADAGHGEFNATDVSGTFIIDNNDFVEIGRKYESITGVLTYDYGNYKLVPRTAEDVVLAPEESLLETLLSGDLSKSEEVAEGFIDLVEEGSLTSKEVANLIEEALSEVATNDEETTSTIERLSLQIENNLERVEKGHHNPKVISLINSQVKKKFVRNIEKDIQKVLEDGKEEQQVQ